MSEKIRAQVPSEKKITEIELRRRTQFHAGGLEPKAQIEGAVGERAISLVERRGISNRRYLEAWKLFKEAGLPVVPTVRTDADKDRLLLTDLKADGSELYGKGLWVVEATPEDPRIAFRRRPELDAIFLKLMEPEAFVQIQKQIDDSVERVSQHRFSLPSDDPFELLIHPNGRWELIILDLTWAMDLRASKLTTEQIAQANRGYAQRFVEILHQLKNQLKNKHT